MTAVDYSAQPVAPRPRRRGQIPLHRKLAYFAVLMLMLLGASEFLVRVYWNLQGLPFWACQRNIQHIYYPGVVTFDAFMRPRGAKKESVEVLLLGASTLYPNVGPISTMLMEQLTLKLKRKVEVVDLAIPAHTTLDSYYKYLELGGKSFDLVVVYDSINDLRANNCPQEVFREDYSHFQFYREVNAAERGREGRIFALPITLRIWAIRLEKELNLIQTMPENATVGDWSKYGSDVRSVKPYSKNLERIVELGRERGEKVVLMSFAGYSAPGYTKEKFQNRQLDYTVHWFPTELWGTPANIVKGLEIHNAAIRTLVETHKDDTLFVDQAGQIPHEGRYFNDICHLSTEGCARFVENMMPVIVPYLQGLAPEK